MSGMAAAQMKAAAPSSSSSRVLMVAVDPPPPVDVAEEPRRRNLIANEAAGPRFSFGRAFTEGIEAGWAGRFESELFLVSKRNALFGVRLGLEGWGGPNGGGGGIPMSCYLGVFVPFYASPKAPALVFSLGPGLEAAFYDRINDDGGFGIFAPFGTSELGIDFRGVRLLADLQAQYRWQWDADDRWQIRAGASLHLNSDLWDKP